LAPSPLEEWASPLNLNSRGSKARKAMITLLVSIASANFSILKKVYRNSNPVLNDFTKNISTLKK
jgi:hypothetical protein